MDSFPCSECKRECFSELFGTYLLVLIGPGTVIAVSLAPNLNSVTALTIIAFSFASTVAAIVWSLGRYSSHINPAITVAHAVVGKIRKRLLIPFVGFQVLGGVFAGLTLRLIFQGIDSTHFGSTMLASWVSPVAGIALEAVGTFALSFAVLLITSRVGDSRWQAIFVGMTLFALILLFGPLTGASFNPARSMGPSLASSFFQDQYVFWIGPLLGGAGGAFLFMILQMYGRRDDGGKEHSLCMC